MSGPGASNPLPQATPPTSRAHTMVLGSADDFLRHFEREEVAGGSDWGGHRARLESRVEPSGEAHELNSVHAVPAVELAHHLCVCVCVCVLWVRR